MIDIMHGDIVDIAKIFWSGRSQAVRLPKDFRFDTDRVRVRRKGSAVILEPIPRNWDWLETIIGTLDEDFVKATEEQLPEQERPDLDVFE
jgi:antitoxin VapB